MRKKRTIHDPDLGPIKLPLGERITQAAWDRRESEIVEKIRAQRAYKPGRSYPCPVCRKVAFEGRSDITYEAPYEGKIVVFGHLHGARCRACKAETIEAYELIDIESRVGVGLRADYEAKVTRIGSGTLGTYWPKDVERVLGLRPDKRAFIQVIGPDAVLVRFREPS